MKACDLVFCALLVISPSSFAGQNHAQGAKMEKSSGFQHYGQNVSKMEYDAYVKKLRLKPGSAVSIETPTGGESIYNVKNKEGQSIQVRSGTSGGVEFGSVAFDPNMGEPPVNSGAALTFIPLDKIADRDQLKMILLVNNPQMRANIARAIAAERTADFDLTLPLLNDYAKIQIAGMNDLPPNPDEMTQVRGLVKKLRLSLGLK